MDEQQAREDARISSPELLSVERMRELLAATPRGLSLGRLGEIAAHVAGWQGQVPPRVPAQPRVIIFAGDHGIAARGISAYAPQASVEQAEELQTGRGPVHTLARRFGASVRLVDVSLDWDAWGPERVLRSCPAVDENDAMTAEELERALSIGRSVADQEVDAGCDLLIPGELGVGATTVAAIVMGALTHTEPVAIVGPGSGITDEMWKRKVAVIRDAMFRVRGTHGDTMEVLRRVSSPDFVALVGFIGQAARRRTGMLIDGALVSAATYAAKLLWPGVQKWTMAGQLSKEPAHRVAVEKLGLTPIVALDQSTGQATGALAALPLVLSAVELAADEANAAAASK